MHGEADWKDCQILKFLVVPRKQLFLPITLSAGILTCYMLLTQNDEVHTAVLTDFVGN